jgi:hypothetical protein
VENALELSDVTMYSSISFRSGSGDWIVVKSVYTVEFRLSDLRQRVESRL